MANYHHVHLTYLNSTLTVTISVDANLSPIPTATQVYHVDIPAIVGGPTAYIGFTGGTGGLVSAGDIAYLNYSTP